MWRQQCLRLNKVFKWNWPRLSPMIVLLPKLIEAELMTALLSFLHLIQWEMSVKLVVTLHFSLDYLSSVWGEKYEFLANYHIAKKSPGNAYWLSGLSESCRGIHNHMETAGKCALGLRHVSRPAIIYRLWWIMFLIFSDLS